MQLSLYDVIVFIDDSGSMLEGSKWQDLQAIVRQIVEITIHFDIDGIQVGMRNDFQGPRFVNADMLFPSRCLRLISPCSFRSSS